MTTPERRLFTSSLTVERRAAEGAEPAPAKVVGHAAVFDSWTTLYDGRYYQWREVIRPGAFKRAIKEGQDVRALFNHDDNFVLGRTKSGTLKLTEDETGLRSETTPPDTQTVRDMVLTPIERGDIDGMSFGFRVKRGGDTKRTDKEDGSTVIESPGERITLRYEGEKTFEDREVLDVDLFDISPVTFPAYTGTDVAIRAYGADIETRAREKDVPRRVPTPKRDQAKARLEATARLLGGSENGRPAGKDVL